MMVYNLTINLWHTQVLLTISMFQGRSFDKEIPHHLIGDNNSSKIFLESGSLKKTTSRVFRNDSCICLYVGLSPCPVTVTTRNITFLVGDPYKPSLFHCHWRGDNPTYMLEIESLGNDSSGMKFSRKRGLWQGWRGSQEASFTWSCGSLGKIYPPGN